HRHNRYCSRLAATTTGAATVGRTGCTGKTATSLPSRGVSATSPITPIVFRPHCRRRRHVERRRFRCKDPLPRRYSFMKGMKTPHRRSARRLTMKTANDITLSVDELASHWTETALRLLGGAGVHPISVD